jgi:hypothetical protein
MLTALTIRSSCRSRPRAAASGDGRQGGLSRSVPRTRDDGADVLHGEGRRRSRGGVGRRAGSAQRPRDGVEGAGHSAGERPVSQPPARRRLRTQVARLAGFHRHGRTHREGHVARAGQDDRENDIQLADAPEIRVEFIRSDARLGGMGEPCVPPVAAAVANAIFAATGIRVRDLPVKNHDLSRA